MHTSLLTAAETRPGGQPGWEPALPTRVSATGGQFYPLVSQQLQLEDSRKAQAAPQRIPLEHSGDKE